MRWCEERMKHLVIQEKLHVAMVKAIQGPLTITYQLRMTQHSQSALRKLLGLGSVIAQALQVDGVRVTSAMGHILVEIPSPIKMTPNAIYLSQFSSGLNNVAIGLDQWRQPITVNLADHGAVYWIGPSRRGKTQSMKSTLYGTIQANPGIRFVIFVIPRKYEEMAAFGRVDGCLGIVSKPHEVDAAMKFLVAQLHTESSDEVIVLIDDLINLQRTVGDLSGELDQIASAGAGLGMHLLVGTQGAGSKSRSGGDAVEQNLTARILYKPSSARVGSVNAGAKNADVGLLELSNQKGDAIFLENGYSTRIATAYCEDRDIMRLPSANQSLSQSSHSTVTPSVSEKSQLSQLSQSSHSLSHPHTARETMTPVTKRDQRDARLRDEILATLPNCFPITPARSLVSEEAEAVRSLYETGLFSPSLIADQVYGSRNSKRVAWINQALEETAGSMNGEMT